MIKYNEMSIDVNHLELLGCDYRRSVDYYLDRHTGKLYARRVVLVSVPGNVGVAESEFFELIEGDEITDPFGGVLAKEN